MGIHLLDIDVARVFKGIDANHNGRISIDELRVALFPRERVRVTPHRSEGPPSAKRRAQALDALRSKASIAGLKKGKDSIKPPPPSAAVVTEDVEDEDELNNLQNQIYFLELECALLRKEAAKEGDIEVDNEEKVGRVPNSSRLLESDDIDAQLRHLRDTSHRQQQEQKRFISKLESEIRQLHAEVSLCVNSIYDDSELNQNTGKCSR